MYFCSGIDSRGLDRANIKWFPEHVACRSPPMAWISAVISKHCYPPKTASTIAGYRFQPG
jgi:hypothetical protein